MADAPPSLVASSGASTLAPLAPLRCGRCDAAVPIADGASVTCPYCGASVAVPEPYRVARDAHRLEAADKARIDRLYRRLAPPPGRMLLAIAAVDALIGKILLYTCLVSVPALAIISIARIDGWMIDLAPTLGCDLPQAIGAMWFALVEVAIPVLILIAPLLVAQHRARLADVRDDARRFLAAAPPDRTGGPATCRACGAPLMVAPGELGARCGYCGADNLVAVTVDRAASERATASEHRDWAAGLVADVHHERARFAWKTSLVLLVFGVLYLWCYAMESADMTPDNEHELPPAFHEIRRSPRPILAYDGARWQHLQANEHVPMDVPAGTCDMMFGVDYANCGETFILAMRRGESFSVISPEIPREGTFALASPIGLLGEATRLPWSYGDSKDEDLHMGWSKDFVAPWTGYFSISIALAKLDKPGHYDVLLALHPPKPAAH